MKRGHREREAVAGKLCPAGEGSKDLQCAPGSAPRGCGAGAVMGLLCAMGQLCVMGVVCVMG